MIKSVAGNAFSCTSKHSIIGYFCLIEQEFLNSALCQVEAPLTLSGDVKFWFDIETFFGTPSSKSVKKGFLGNFTLNDHVLHGR